MSFYCHCNSRKLFWLLVQYFLLVLKWLFFCWRKIKKSVTSGDQIELHSKLPELKYDSVDVWYYCDQPKLRILIAITVKSIGLTVFMNIQYSIVLLCCTFLTLAWILSNLHSNQVYYWSVSHAKWSLIAGNLIYNVIWK